MHKRREFASSDPTQLTCRYAGGLDYSYRSPVTSFLQQNPSSFLWRPCGLLGIYGHLCNNRPMQNAASVPSLAVEITADIPNSSEM